MLVGWNKSVNFGTCMQAIALYRTLNKMYDCSVFFGRRYYSLSMLVKGALRKMINLLFRKNKNAITYSQCKYENIDNAFKGFNRIRIDSPKDLKNILNTYSAFVVGSDQVWNPYYLRETYLLDFVPKGKEYKKVSYASSIGVTQIPVKYHKKYKKYLSDFYYISMREQQGADCLSKIINKPIEVVLDPTLLLTADEWKNYASDYIKEKELPKKYILCYFVGKTISHWDKVKQISTEKNLPLVILPMNKHDLSIEGTVYLNDAGPKEFINALSNAEFVCTDSFHMCAFSINFNKQFVAFRRFAENDVAGQNSRLDNLFSMFSIDAFYRGNIEFIDYANINNVLNNKRSECINKLYRAIEE